MRRASWGRGSRGRVTSAAARFGAETLVSRGNASRARPGTTHRTAGNAGPTRGTASRTTCVQRCVALFVLHDPRRAWSATGSDRRERIPRARVGREPPYPECRTRRKPRQRHTDARLFSRHPLPPRPRPLSRLGTQCAAQCKCVGGDTKCHTSTVRVARIRKRVAASGDRADPHAGSTGTRRTGDSVWVRRPSASDPGLSRALTVDRLVRSLSMRVDG